MKGKGESLVASNNCLGMAKGSAAMRVSGPDKARIIVSTPPNKHGEGGTKIAPLPTIRQRLIVCS
jgi:hypothetical protein